MSLTPFTIPLTPLDPNRAPAQIRSALNQIVQALNTLSGFSTLFGPTSVNAGIAAQVLAAPSAPIVAYVWGHISATTSFVDTVIYDPGNVSASITPVASTATRGSPATRTYTTDASGNLKLMLGGATAYTVTVIGLVL